MSPAGDEWRLVQLTPPGSPCSVMFGKGFTTAVPGSLQGTFLVVDDLEAARAELVRHGADVSDVFHFEEQAPPWLPHDQGPHAGQNYPKNGSYFSFASFSDPDGNSWLLQEVTARLPGRGFSSDVATLIGLLRETEERHGERKGDRAKAPLVRVVHRIHRGASAWVRLRIRRPQMPHGNWNERPRACRHKGSRTRSQCLPRFTCVVMWGRPSGLLERTDLQG